MKRKRGPDLRHAVDEIVVERLVSGHKSESSAADRKAAVRQLIAIRKQLLASTGELITRDEIARRAGVSRRTVDRYMAKVNRG